MPDSESTRKAHPGSEKSNLSMVAPGAAEPGLQQRTNNVILTCSHQLRPMVALGGSAGAIGSLQAFFRKMLPDSGMAFVVILHLSSEHHSGLAEVLQRTTAMPVVQAQDGVQVEPNRVYVIPPGKHLTVSDGHLQLADLPAERGRQAAVDLFFRSLADTHGPNATAIVLSGGTGDGALGLKRVKERGGLTIAQDPDEAEHAGMPRAAIATGLVDWVLPVAEMPGRVLEYHNRARRLQLPPDEGVPPGPASDGDEAVLRDVLTFVCTRTGRDFSYYKRATLLRRLARRMQVNGVDDLAAYLAFLRIHPGEAGALLKDLLISVTNFFRDREAFEALERHIPVLFTGKDHADAVRVWVPACATGEEAYSIAMLLLEHARRLEAPPGLQVFACDLDEEAVQVARAGLYPDTIAADVPEERLQRFFVREGQALRVRRELRETVLFAAHDLLNDAPFCRLDLISCRNLLIYLNHEAQERVLNTFHFALKPAGRLFLGASEAVEDGDVRFTALDKKHRLYASQAVQPRIVPVPGEAGILARALEVQVRAKEHPVLPGHSFDQGSPRSQPREEPGAGEHTSWAELHFRLVEQVISPAMRERFTPPSLIVNRRYDVVHVAGQARRFLQPADDGAASNLLQAVHPALRVGLSAALGRAAGTGRPVEVFGIPVELEGQRRSVDLRVAPLRELAPDFLLVVFDDRQPPAALEAGEREPTTAALQEASVAQLERELEEVKARLRTTAEQYGATVEELQAGNEELQAMNEELRAAGEELETSREELQSINEELTTVNQELKHKADELAHANSDLQNLMASTAIATVFLDDQLRIARYTPSAAPLFNLLPSDAGRPLAHFATRLDFPELQRDAQRVLETLVPVEREVNQENERWFLARLLPYRTTDNRIAGVVLTLVDITERKQVEAALRLNQEHLRLILENAREYAIFSVDLERRITRWNAGAERLLGYREQEVAGQSADVIFTPEDRAAGAPEQEAQKALADGRAVDERWHVRKDGSRFWSSGVTMPMRNAQSRVIGFVKIFRDQTATRAAQEALERSRQELWAALQETERARAEAEAADRAKDHFLAGLSHELRTPLTPVLLTVKTLMRRGDLPPDVLEGLEMVGRNVQLEARFVDDLLDLSRIARGRMEVAREPLDLHETVRHAVEVTRPDVEAKRQSLAVTLEAPEHQVYGDARRLQQVFWNLLKNASKFTREQGAIAIRSRNEAGRVVVEVSDTGIGFDAEAAARIFDPFEQADSSVARE
ncbi:MAG: PAS domain-containing protein, partial [Verrucomicrobia bacterium]|nr:PAS domain-containing protein [Verrucomicrobiota bacterium]